MGYILRTDKGIMKAKFNEQTMLTLLKFNPGQWTNSTISASCYLIDINVVLSVGGISLYFWEGDRIYHE